MSINHYNFVICIKDDSCRQTVVDYLKKHFSGCEICEVRDAKDLNGYVDKRYIILLDDDGTSQQSGKNILLQELTANANVILFSSPPHQLGGKEFRHMYEIEKPFRIDEIKPLIERLVRERKIFAPEESDYLKIYEDIWLDIAGRKLLKIQNSNYAGEYTDYEELTDKETSLLQELLEMYNDPTDINALSKEHMLQKIWGYSTDINTHTIETHIYRLRGKLASMTDKVTITAENNGYAIKTKNGA